MSPSIDMGTTCVLAQAEALRDRLVAFLQDVPGDVATIDLGRVDVADISLVQLMLSASRTAAAKGIRLEVSSSPTADAILAQAGLPGWALAPQP